MKEETGILSNPLLYWVLGLLLAVIVCAMSLGIFMDARLSGIENRIETLGSADLPVLASGEKYTLRQYCGRIGIFTDDSDEPAEILGVYVFTLPEADQKALEIGITVYDVDGLRSLIEDFSA